jgi:hypothetical protein
MIKWEEIIVKVGLEDGVPVAILYENGHDIFYVLKKASKQQKGELLGIDRVEEK